MQTIKSIADVTKFKFTGEVVVFENNRLQNQAMRVDGCFFGYIHRSTLCIDFNKTGYPIDFLLPADASEKTMWTLLTKEEIEQGVSVRFMTEGELEKLIQTIQSGQGKIIGLKVESLKKIYGIDSK